MMRLSIVLAAQENVYLRETVTAAHAAAAACGVQAEIIAAADAAHADDVRQTLTGLPDIRMCTVEAAGAAQLQNCGASAAGEELLLFLRAGVILTAEGLHALLQPLLSDEKVAAAGPFLDRTLLSWQYLNAARIRRDGMTPEAYLAASLNAPTQSLVLEDAALLIRRSVWLAAGGYDEAFTAGGADIDLSLRLVCAGHILLRVPAYCAHLGAEECELWDLARTRMRPMLSARWGLDIGMPESLWQPALEAVAGCENEALIRATLRSALLRTPLVSVLIPVESEADAVSLTVDSALAQTYPHIEIVVRDTSGAPCIAEMMRAYADEPRVRYVRCGTGTGNCAAVESLAQGDFLQFCTPGDILLPDRIALMMERLLSAPEARAVVSVCGQVDAAGALTGLSAQELPLCGLWTEMEGRSFGREMLCRQENPLGEYTAALLRRADLPADGARGEESVRLWLYLLVHGDVHLCAQPLLLHAAPAPQDAADVVREALLWRHLLEEEGRRHVFLSEADGSAVQEAFGERCAAQIEPLLPAVPEELRQAYAAKTPSLHIIVMSRVEECAPVRLDAPFARLRKAGDLSLAGCTQRGAAPIELDEVGAVRDSILLLQRAVLRRSSAVRDLLAAHGARGNVLLQEIDDHPMISQQNVRDGYFSYRAVSAVQTSTQPLADFLRDFNPYIYLFENQLTELPARRTYDAAAQQVTIFFGALNRQPDWAPLMPALNAAIRRYGTRLHFRVLSDRAFYDALETDAKTYEGGARDASIVVPYERYAAALHSADIALLPLNDTVFNRAKSDLKFIESAGHGAAVLAAPTVYERTVRDGETGLIYRTPEEFAQKLALLIERPRLRISIAERAYRYVAENRLLSQHIGDYAAAYAEMRARHAELERARLARIEEAFAVR